MRGCLSLPFRLAVLAALIVGGYLAWTHRAELRRTIHQWTAEPGEPTGPPEAVGDPALAPAAVRKVAALGGAGARADSVVLSPTDLASLIAAGVAFRAAGGFDSVRVRLARDELRIETRVDTRRIPLSFPALRVVLRDYEPVEAGGPLDFRRRGLAEWRVTRVRVRGIPLPVDVMTRLLGRFGAGSEPVVPVPLPITVGGLRVTPQGVVLYGGAPP